MFAIANNKNNKIKMAKTVDINIEINTKKGVKSIGDLNNEVKLTLNTLGDMEEASALIGEKLRTVDVGTKAYEILRQELINVNTEIKNQELAMEALDNEQVASELKSVVGGLTDMAGGLVLIGVSGENVEKIAQTFVKVEAASKLVTGGMEAYASASKLSGTATKILNKLTKTAIVLKIRETIATAQAAAVTNTATLSQKALNLVMKANPIGLIVTAVTLLIGGILYLTDSIDGIIDTFKEWGASLLNLIPGFALLKGAYDYFFGEEAKAIDDSIEKQKKRVKVLEKEEAILKAKARQINSFYSKEKNAIQDSIDAAKARGENTDELTLKFIKLQKQEAHAVRANAAEQIKVLAEAIKLKIKLGDLTEEERDKLKEDLQAAKDSYKESTKNLKDATNAEQTIITKANNKKIEEGKKYAARVLKAEEELTLLRAKAIEDDTERQIELLNIQFNKKISTLSKNIKAEADLITQLELDKNNKIQEIKDKANQKVRDNELKVIKLQQDLNKLTLVNTKLTVDEQIKISSDGFALQQDLLQEKLDTEKITLEEFNVQSLIITQKRINDENKIVEKGLSDQLTIEKNLLEDKITLLEIEATQVKDNQDILIAIENERYNQSTNNLKEQLANDEITQKEYNSKLNILQTNHNIKIGEINDEARKLENEKRLEQANLTIDIAGKVADIFGMLAEQRQKEIQDELDAVQSSNDKQSEIIQSRLDKGLITEREAAIQKEKLDAETAAKQLKLRKEAFESKKKTDLVSAAINTALGITSALASPFPLSIIMTALAAATGAIQIAAISGQQFKAAQGGIVPGTPSGIDSVSALLSPGEVVINSNSAQQFAPELSAINQAGGGKALIPNNVNFDNANNNSGNVVKAYVVETEITDTQKGVRKIEDLATF